MFPNRKLSSYSGFADQLRVGEKARRNAPHCCSNTPPTAVLRRRIARHHSSNCCRKSPLQPSPPRGPGFARLRRRMRRPHSSDSKFKSPLLLSPPPGPGAKSGQLAPAKNFAKALDVRLRRNRCILPSPEANEAPLGTHLGNKESPRHQPTIAS